MILTYSTVTITSHADPSMVGLRGWVTKTDADGLVEVSIPGRHNHHTLWAGTYQEHTFFSGDTVSIVTRQYWGGDDQHWLAVQSVRSNDAYTKLAEGDTGLVLSHVPDVRNQKPDRHLCLFSDHLVYVPSLYLTRVRAGRP